MNLHRNARLTARGRRLLVERVCRQQVALSGGKHIRAIAKGETTAAVAARSTSIAAIKARCRRACVLAGSGCEVSRRCGWVGSSG